MHDRLSKSLTFCAETTAHVIQRHNDGRAFQQESSELHTGGEKTFPQVDAGDAHLCDLGEIQLQGAEMEVLLGTYLQCEARLRTPDMLAVKSVCHQSTKDIHGTDHCRSA